MDHAHDAAFWDRMYRHRPATGASEPNPVLAEAAADLAPGSALDVACGEGSDALWLARRGWNVTAVDISSVALDRARAADAQHQVNWIHGDVLAWQPPEATYDLISLHYVHIAPEERAGLFGRLARAMRPGGTILVVAHHPSDHETTVGRPQIADLFFTSEDIAAALTPGRWEILQDGTQPRSVTDPGGRTITIQDAVLAARRIA